MFTPTANGACHISVLLECSVTFLTLLRSHLHWFEPGAGFTIVLAGPQALSVIPLGVGTSRNSVALTTFEDIMPQRL
jgi:hypothetical protein